MSTRDLYGGLVTATIPLNVIDLNDDPYVFLIRCSSLLTLLTSSWVQEVPDSQEVFRYDSSNAIIVIEVLQKVAPQDGDDPVR